MSPITYGCADVDGIGESGIQPPIPQPARQLEQFPSLDAPPVIE